MNELKDDQVEIIVDIEEDVPNGDIFGLHKIEKRVPVAIKNGSPSQSLPNNLIFFSTVGILVGVALTLSFQAILHQTTSERNSGDPSSVDNGGGEANSYSSSLVGHYEQCGGLHFSSTSSPKLCRDDWVCVASDEYYSQCRPPSEKTQSENDENEENSTSVVVDTVSCSVDIEELGKDEFRSFCRCSKSKKFPLCDGSHVKHNKETGDNIG